MSASLQLVLMNLDFMSEILFKFCFECKFICNFVQCFYLQVDCVCIWIVWKVHIIVFNFLNFKRKRFEFYLKILNLFKFDGICEGQ
jgi:hypothetical protein